MDAARSSRTRERTLASAVREGPLPVGEALRFAIGAADAVARAHARGDAFGGLDPERLVLLPGGVVRIADEPVARDGVTAPAGARAADLYALGAVLALALGSPEGGAVPARLAELLRVAETRAVPAAALAAALRDLEHAPPGGAAPPERGIGSRWPGPLAVVPPAARRAAGTAVAVLSGATTAGIVLLLAGVPGGPGWAPTGTGPHPTAQAAAPELPARSDRLLPTPTPSLRDTPPASASPTAVPSAAAVPSRAPARSVPVPTRAAAPVPDPSTTHRTSGARPAPARTPAPSRTPAPTSSAGGSAPSASATPVPTAPRTSAPSTSPTAAPAPRTTRGVTPTAAPSASPRG